jgi:CrcB protein
VRVAAVAVGGALGALGRVGLAEAWPATGWPWPTLLANVAGSLLLGWAVVALPAVGRSGVGLLAVGTGFCGALTTFSAFQIELITLGRAGRPALAVGYAAVSLTLGLAAAAAGRRAGGDLAAAG